VVRALCLVSVGDNVDHLGGVVPPPLRHGMSPKMRLK
jgi:hypothetical protein